MLDKILRKENGEHVWQLGNVLGYGKNSLV